MDEAELKRWLTERIQAVEEARANHLAEFNRTDDDRSLDRVISCGSRVSAYKDVLNWVEVHVKHAPSSEAGTTTPLVFTANATYETPCCRKTMHLHGYGYSSNGVDDDRGFVWSGVPCPSPSCSATYTITSFAGPDETA